MIGPPRWRATSISDHRGDHDLVGDRIEEHAEPRHRALGAGEIAVEIIGDAHQAVEHEGERVVEPAAAPATAGSTSNGTAKMRDSVRMFGSVSIVQPP